MALNRSELSWLPGNTTQLISADRTLFSSHPVVLRVTDEQGASRFQVFEVALLRAKRSHLFIATPPK